MRGQQLVLKKVPLGLKKVPLGLKKVPLGASLVHALYACLT